MGVARHTQLILIVFQIALSNFSGGTFSKPVKTKEDLQYIQSFKCSKYNLQLRKPHRTSCLKYLQCSVLGTSYFYMKDIQCPNNFRFDDVLLKCHAAEAHDPRSKCKGRLSQTVTQAPTVKRIESLVLPQPKKDIKSSRPAIGRSFMKASQSNTLKENATLASKANASNGTGGRQGLPPPSFQFKDRSIGFVDSEAELSATPATHKSKSTQADLAQASGLRLTTNGSAKPSTITTTSVGYFAKVSLLARNDQFRTTQLPSQPTSNQNSNPKDFELTSISFGKTPVSFHTTPGYSEIANISVRDTQTNNPPTTSFEKAANIQVTPADGNRIEGRWQWSTYQENREDLKMTSSPTSKGFSSTQMAQTTDPATMRNIRFSNFSIQSVGRSLREPDASLSRLKNISSDMDETQNQDLNPINQAKPVQAMKYINPKLSDNLEKGDAVASSQSTHNNATASAQSKIGGRAISRSETQQGVAAFSKSSVSGKSAFASSVKKVAIATAVAGNGAKAVAEASFDEVNVHQKNNNNEDSAEGADADDLRSEIDAEREAELKNYPQIKRVPGSNILLDL